MIKRNSNKFLQNTAIYTLSDVLNKLVPFVLLPVLTRYLTPEDYGIIAIFFVFTGILGVFMTLELNTVIGIKFFKLNRTQLKVYIANMLLITCISCSILLTIVIFQHSTLSRVLSLPSEWLFIGVFVTLLQFFTTVNLVLWQSEHRAISFGIYQIIQTVLNMSLSIVLIIGFGMNWEGRLIAVSINSILFGMLSLSLLNNRRYIKFQLNKAFIKDGINFSIPLLPHALGAWIRTGTDRILLTILIGSSATGLYTVGFQIASVIMVLTMAINKSFAPHLFQQLNAMTVEQKTKYVKYMYLSFVFLLLMAGLLSLASPFIINTFVGSEFKDSQKFITLLAFGFAFYGMNLILTNYILYLQKTILLSYITLIIGIIHIGLTYILIDYYGAMGAAKATIITSLLTLICVWHLSHKLYPMPWLKVLRKVL